MARKRGNQNKNQKTNRSTALVVYQPQKARAKVSKTKKKSSVTSSDVLQRYYAALVDPFGSMAVGARVPDMYSAPTITRHLTKSITISTDASGLAELVVLPNAAQNAISTRGSISAGGNSWTLLDGTVIANGCSYSPTSGGLAANMVNYRIVGMGVKIFAVSSLTSSSGKVIVAKTPVSSWVNTKDLSVGAIFPNISVTSASRANTLISYGLPASGNNLDSATLPTLPTSVETSVVALAGKPLQVTPKVTSPEAFNFRQSSDSSIGFDIADQSSTSFVNAGDASYLRVAGFETVAVAVSGAPASTAVLEAEIIYHLEGTPAFASSPIGGDATSTVVNPSGWQQIIAKVAKSPSFKMGVETVGNTVYPGLGSLVTRMF